jgi:cation transport regulator ChaB
MPKSKKDLPSTIARSEGKAQETWSKAHDSAVESYGEGERAHRTAFAALKHGYRKEGDQWVEKSKKGPSDEQAARGPKTRPSSREEPAPTAGGRVATAEASKEDLYAQARELDIKGRSSMNKKELARAIKERS